MKHSHILKFLFILTLIISGFNKIVYAQTQTPLIWAKSMGGTDEDIGTSIASDDSGNVYSTGVFGGYPDFDPGPGKFNIQSAGNTDIFISKLNAKGNLVWVKTVGGGGEDFGSSIALDDSGNIYLTGYFEAKADFDPGSGTFYFTSVQLTDAFVLKLSNSGNFVWARQFGGLKDGAGTAITLDDSGNVYTTGVICDTVDFDPGSGIFRLPSYLAGCCYVSKLNNAGNFVWAKMLGLASTSAGTSIAINDSGYIYTAGWFGGTGDFDPGSNKFNLTSSSSDIFISKLNRNGNFVWALKLGGSNSDEAYALALDKYGNVYTTGKFRSTGDFNPGSGTYNLTSVGGEDVFVSKLSPSGAFIWAQKVGTGDEDRALAIAVDDSCHVYISGNFGGSVFISKLDSLSKNVLINRLGSTWGDKGLSIKVDKARNIYTIGAYHSRVDFDNTRAVFELQAFNNADVFIQKVKQCQVTLVTITPSICLSYKIPSGKRTYTVSGTYKDTLINVAGCDSIITIKLTILKKTLRTISVLACKKYPSPSKKYIWTANGTYTDTIPNKAGCDSILTIKLTINTKATSSNISASACSMYISPSKKYSWTANGTYMDTILNAGACDSVITINLTIKNNTTGSISPVACNSFTSPSKKYVWLKSGNYSDTIKNKIGCDSIISINLKVNYKTTGLISPIECKQFNSPSKKYVWLTSGTYIDTIKNVQGCDSIITVKLKINKTFGTISPTVCYNYKSPSSKYIWTSNGTYKDTVPNKAGCDSIITINLKIKNITLGSISPTACNQYISPSKKFIWFGNGTYYDTLKNKQGCDSIITIKLVVNNVDISVSNNSPTLKANLSGAIYQWFLCTKPYTVIGGATNQSYTAVINGFYAVNITQNSCTDTSICYQINNVGLVNNVLQNNINIYPNPTNGEIHINLKNENNIKAIITNVLGEIVLEKELSGSSFVLNIDQKSGVYFVNISTLEGQTAIFKVVKGVFNNH